MRKFAVFALLVSFVAFGFAEDAQPAATAPAPAAPAATNLAAKPVEKTLSGTVVSYTPADTAKNTLAVLVVKIGAKNETFVIDAKTVLEGKDKKAVAVSALKAGAKVDVKFTTDDKKVMTAVSVTLK